MANGANVEDISMQLLLQSVKNYHFVVLQVVTKTDGDAFGAYLHMGGRIGVLTVLEGTTDEEAAKDVSMHIAALKPKICIS